MIAVKSLNKSAVAIGTDAVTAALEDGSDRRSLLFGDGVKVLVDLEISVHPVVWIAQNRGVDYANRDRYLPATHAKAGRD